MALDGMTLARLNPQDRLVHEDQYISDPPHCMAIDLATWEASCMQIPLVSVEPLVVAVGDLSGCDYSELQGVFPTIGATDLPQQWDAGHDHTFTFQGGKALRTVKVFSNQFVYSDSLA